mmetsp:Transcript_11266/g.29745  ORF Transcript_11266/g.29745 Transcript_11266/m.29745 type:complete len:133 (+) Transcript_11266:611-1009(+)
MNQETVLKHKQKPFTFIATTSTIIFYISVLAVPRSKEEVLLSFLYIRPSTSLPSSFGGGRASAADMNPLNPLILPPAWQHVHFTWMARTARSRGKTMAETGKNTMARVRMRMKIFLFALVVRPAPLFTITTG